VHGNYDGEIAQFWTTQFRTLAAGAAVLDIGTGNGAVAVLARDHSESRNALFCVHGIDGADISPVSTRDDGAEYYKGIEFHPNTMIQQTPFQDGRFDLVCSQFAFEYAADPASIAEIDRVIGPSGRLAMVMHSDDSIISKVATKQLAGCDYLLRGSLMFERLHALLELLCSNNRPEQRRLLAADERAEAVRERFNESASELMASVAEPGCSEIVRKYARSVVAIVQQGMTDPGRALADWGELIAALHDEEGRLFQLRGALLNESGVGDIAERFRQLGFLVECSELRQAGEKMGWTLVATRG